MKILYVTTIGATMHFFESIIESLTEEGNQIDLACNYSESKIPEFYDNLGCQEYMIDCSRRVFDRGNLRAIRQIRKIIRDEQYDIVHCHTPIGAACTRIACMKLRSSGKLKVFYTAHGFHFYKGAPIKNWLIFYPIERMCSRMTDVLITINREDYEFARKHMKSGKIEYLPGVGVDVDVFKNINVNIKEKKLEIGVPEDATIMLSVGELNDNKNHKMVIEALKRIGDDSIHYVIAGEGDNKNKLMSLAENLGLKDRVHLLGFRSDVKELYKIADVLIHPSFREGLPVSVMEALASGLKVVASNIRGNADLISEDNGVLFNKESLTDLVKSIEQALQMDKEKVSLRDDFSKKNVTARIKELYKNILEAI